MKPCSSTQETIQTRRERGNFGLGHAVCRTRSTQKRVGSPARQVGSDTPLAGNTVPCGSRTRLPFLDASAQDDVFSDGFLANGTILGRHGVHSRDLVSRG